MLRLCFTEMLQGRFPFNTSRTQNFLGFKYYGLYQGVGLRRQFKFIIVYFICGSVMFVLRY